MHSAASTDVGRRYSGVATTEAISATIAFMSPRRQRAVVTDRRRLDVEASDRTGDQTAAPRRRTQRRATPLRPPTTGALESGSELNVYRCDWCSAWHMGKAAGSDAD